MFAFGLIIAAQAVDGLFLAGYFVAYRDRLQIDRDLIIEERERSEPVNDAGVSFLRPPFDGKEGVVMAVEIERRSVLQADAIAVPAEFLNRQLRLKQISKVN